MKITGGKVSNSGKPQGAGRAQKSGPASSVFAALLATQAGGPGFSGEGGGQAPQDASSPAPGPHNAIEDMRRAFGELSTQSAGLSVAVQRVTTDTGLLPYALLIKHADTAQGLNAASEGNIEPTTEQIQRLRLTYDFARLSPQQQYDFYRELTQMGILTAAEVESIGMSHIMLKGGFFARAPEFALMIESNLPQTTLAEWTRALVENEQKQYAYMESIGQRLTTEPNYSDDAMKNAYLLFNKNRPAIDKLLAQHRKIARIVETIENSK